MQFKTHPKKHLIRHLLIGLSIIGGIASTTVQAGGIPPGREVAWLTHLANTGDTGAQLQLGLAYREGRYGLARNPRASLHWLTAAARGGDAYAADVLANDYATGKEGPCNPQQAVRWWSKSAKEGNADAQTHLGESMLKKGQDNKALTWLRDAADRGDPQARKDLARLYRKEPLPDADLHRGENPFAALGARLDSPGLKTLTAVWDAVEASSTEEQSRDALINRAKHGDPLAEYQLGMRYRDGSWDVRRDPKKAMMWLQRSAEAGNRVAEETLADISKNGKASPAHAATPVQKTTQPND